MSRMQILYLDDEKKWGIAFDAHDNDKPVSWVRYNEHHSTYDGNNPTTSMFYKLLELAQPYMIDDYQ